MSSLKQQLRKVTEGQSAKQQLLSNEERSLARENVSLKDANAKLREELWRTQERNKRLEEVCTCSWEFVEVIFGFF